MIKRQQAEAFWRNLTALGAPHEILAVLLLDYLEWRPAEVVAEWSHKPLHEVASWVERECRGLEQLASREVVDSCLAELHQGLHAPLSATNVEEGGPGMRAVVGAPIGELVLAAFFGSDPPNNVALWCARLKQRIRLATYEEYPALFD